MRVGIIGAGALGSVLGGLLSEGGVDAVLVERDREQVRVVRENGLWLEGVSGDRLIRPQIIWDTAEVGKVDLALVLVKAYDTRGAIATVEQVLSDEGVVLTLQNGIGNYETLEPAFPGRVLLGTTTIGAMALGAGRFRHTGVGPTHLGEPDGIIRERTRAVASVLEKMNAGPVHPVENAMGSVWSKLIINAAINAPCTLLRLRNGDLPFSQAGKELIHEVVEECLTIARAKGIRLIFDDPEERVIAVCKGTSGNINSMFQDIIAGRRTEIEFINAALVGEAQSVGIAAPANRMLALLIKALEATADRRVDLPV
jgi:2-dehydropantoate 2-reductase